jgi:site-specific recombinase XerD
MRNTQSMRKELPELFDEFMYEYEFVRKVRPATITKYRQVFTVFHKLQPDCSTQMLTSSMMTQFFKVLEERKRYVGKGHIRTGIKKSTVASYWTNLNSFFEWLRIKGYIKQNPFAELRYPTPQYEDKKFLKKEEIEKILTAIITHSATLFIQKRNLVLFYLLLFCGLRREEMLLLQVRDIDMERKLLTVRSETSKVRRTRYIPLHSQLIMCIKDYMHERKDKTTPYLLVSANRDDRLSFDGLKHLVTVLRKWSGVRFHVHQFRHTFAVNFLKSSNNIAKLKQLLGHKDISMTVQYLRCLPPTEMRGDINGMSIDEFI